jgi:ganglioside-induced differentiation-associated protein 1
MAAEITFAASHRHTVARLPPEELKKFLASTPPVSVTPEWHERKKVIVTQGLKAPGVDRAFRLYDSYLQKMEDALARGPWLAGDALSLADIGVAPYVVRLDMLSMSDMWAGSRPALTDWFVRIKNRPSFNNAFLDWIPADLANDLRTFGAQSWPAVREMLRAT